MNQKQTALATGIFLLPLPVTLLIPGWLLSLEKHFTIGGEAEGWVRGILVVAGMVSILVGIFLAWRTVFLFYSAGDGTPVPWNPPKKFVVLGPYRYVRNPMMLGVHAVLLGELILFGSLAILGWFVVFGAGMHLFICCYEEPGLEKRFGDDYRRYKSQVPRWIPRLKPWGGLSV